MQALTFNIWQLGFRSENNTARLDALCRELRALPHDLVFLQEVWFKPTRERLKRESERTVISHDQGLWPSSGLMTLSRYPVVRSEKRTFTHNGLWSHAQDFELACAKGALFALLDTPLGRLWTVNTHVVAQYESEKYHAQRAEQLSELCSWMRELGPNERWLLGGDLNFSADEPTHEGLRSLLPNAIVLGESTFADEGQLDHLRGSAGLLVSEGQRLFTKRFEISDHAAVACKVG